MSTVDWHPRYRVDWQVPFQEAARSALTPGSVVIDIGGGRQPALLKGALPADVTYIGIDLSAGELASAPTGSYDRTIVADVGARLPDLAGCADLIISWQVLEHVAPLDAAIANMHLYLRPGGLLVAQLSGGRSAFALVNRLLPHRLAKLAMERLLQRNPELVFPASYDRCTFSGLSGLFAGWSEVRIIPQYRGAGYFRFLRPLQALYLRYEDLLVRGKHRDLATHYLIVARR